MGEKAEVGGAGVCLQGLGVRSGGKGSAWS